MINVIYSDDVSVFDHSLFPPQHAANMQYIQQNLRNFSNTLTESGQQFMQHFSQVYASINHSEIARKARKAEQSVNGMFNAHAIVPLETLEQLQNAQYMMQRYIMANPVVRAMYHSNRVEGYSDTYVDSEPGRVGEHHTDYRRVMTGLVQESEDGGFRARIFMDEEDINDPKLDHGQRLVIQRTWNAVEREIATGNDITNKFGGEVAP